jgi:hypothetical protein
MGRVSGSINAAEASRAAPFLGFGAGGRLSFVHRGSHGAFDNPVHPSASGEPGDQVQQRSAAVVQASNHGRPPQLSNLDATGMRLVRKGAVVMFRGGFTTRVARVRLGHFYTELGIGSRFDWPCRYVQVIG